MMLTILLTDFFAFHDFYFLEYCHVDIIKSSQLHLDHVYTQSGHVYRKFDVGFLLEIYSIIGQNLFIIHNNIFDKLYKYLKGPNLIVKHKSCIKMTSLEKFHLSESGIDIPGLLDGDSWEKSQFIGKL